MRHGQHAPQAVRTAGTVHCRQRAPRAACTMGTLHPAPCTLHHGQRAPCTMGSMHPAPWAPCTLHHGQHALQAARTTQAPVVAECRCLACPWWGRVRFPRAPRSLHIVHGSGMSGGESRQGEMPRSVLQHTLRQLPANQLVYDPRSEQGLVSPCLMLYPHPGLLLLQPPQCQLLCCALARPRVPRASHVPAGLWLPRAAQPVASAPACLRSTH